MILRGDCRERMRELDDESVDAIVTDPPYELGFMGKGWDASGIAYDIEVWRQALRVLKPGGHLLAFGGSRTYHRMAVAIEDAGFEIRDSIMWLYGSGFPKSHNLDGAWQGWGTALKPAHEPIVVARKPLRGTVAANVLAHGTGALNIDGCRVEGIPPSVPQPSFNSPTGSIYGMKTGQGRNGQMSDAPGRWPANVIHDGSEEVVAGFPITTSGNPSGTRSVPGFATAFEHGTELTGYGDSGSAARFFYCAKASAADRDEGLDAIEERTFNRVNPGGIENDPRWAPIQRRNIHPTVKPTDLMRYLVRLVTPPGGLVLDPFTGSGSTGKAAVLEGFRFVGCELTPEYADIAEARIRSAMVSTGQVFAVPASPAPDPESSGGQLRLFA